MAGTKKRIVVPVDFSDCSRAALDRAIEIGRALDAEITLVHVVDVSGLFLGGVESYIDASAIARRICDDAQKELKNLAVAADPDEKIVKRVEVYEGRPVQAIIDCARDEKADLIVIGTHGRTGIPRLFLGSVAERVVRLAPCDVLAVHGGKPSA
jgi:universal stress protein A